MARYSLLMVPALIMVFLLAAIPNGANGAAVAIDNMRYSPEEPTTDDTIEVTVTLVLVDAEVQDDGVVLEWSLCTDTMCEFPTEVIMTDNGDETWSGSITDIPAKSSSGEPYVEIKFHVEVTADPTDGGTGPIDSHNQQVVLELKEGIVTVDDDDDDTDDDTTDDDSEDSPIGPALTISAMLGAAVLMFIGRRRAH
ncbi:MAG: hypothetical protein U9R75_00560 [Candidatus Thermoplasmatota archaeon]|nr:hypothetical protein [Candidatus Thermoplasmatota archaeon]